MKYQLVNTPLGFKNKSEKILLSGLWSTRSEIYETLKKETETEIEVANYHWSDSRKFSNDYKYLTQLSERTLSLLKENLNNLHDCEESIDYWRILLKPWLNSFIPSIFDRWESVENVLKDYEICNISTIEFLASDVTPNCTFDFNINFNLEDFWNEHIFSLISDYKTKKKNVKLLKNKFDGVIKKPYPKYQNNETKLAQNIFNFISKFKSENTVFFHDISIDKIDKMKLELYLGLLPSNYKSEKINNFCFKKMIRDKIKISEDSHSEFENFLFSLLPYQIPKVFIEGFKSINNKDFRHWPSNPELILSSGSFYADDYFKFYLAKQLSKNKSSLYILQHGGHYGIGKISGMLDYELQIAKKYFSWGWNINSEKIKEFPSIKLSNTLQKNCYSKKGNLLIVGQDTPRYSYHLFSYPYSSEYVNYENEIKSFYKNLKKEIQIDTILRFKHGGRYGWNQKKIFSKQFPHINLDDASSPLSDALSKSRICIQTANFTTYLETLSKNIPTVIFWNPKFNELTDEADIFFKELSKQKIFFSNPKNASYHINQIWEDIDSWWQDKELQNVRKKFVNKYARISNTSVKDFASYIRKDMNKR